MEKVYKFNSGLILYYTNNKINNATSIEISFDCGSRCDGDIPGLSHFCEHMFFTGTDKMSKLEVSKRYFDFIKVNAYTSTDDIVFTGNIMTSKLPQYLDAVYDMICNSEFSSKAVEDEKKIVIQEIVQSKDNYARKAEELLQTDLYKLDYYAKSVLGSIESVSKITNKDVKKYVKKYFVNNNCYISICSPLSFNKVKSVIKNFFEQKMPVNNLKPLPYREEKLLEGTEVNIHKADIEKSFLAIVFKSMHDGLDVKRKVALNIICNIIEDISDGLTKELRIDNGLIYSMGASYMVSKLNSFICVRTEISHENIKPCIDVIIDYIKKVAIEGFSKEQFNKELEIENYYWQTKIDSPNRMRENLMSYRFYQKFITDKTIHNIVKDIDLEYINEVAKELFTNPMVQVFVYGNIDKKDVYTLSQIQKKIKK